MFDPTAVEKLASDLPALRIRRDEMRATVTAAVAARNSNVYLLNCRRALVTAHAESPAPDTAERRLLEKEARLLEIEARLLQKESALEWATFSFTENLIELGGICTRVSRKEDVLAAMLSDATHRETNAALMMARTETLLLEMVELTDRDTAAAMMLKLRAGHAGHTGHAGHAGLETRRPPLTTL